MTEQEMRALDGAELTQLAAALGLLTDVTTLPHDDIHAAVDLFIGLRQRGWTTSQAYFADDRQYGEAWIGCHGRRAYSVQWPRDVPTEALALLLVACLAVVNEEEAAHGHA